MERIENENNSEDDFTGDVHTFIPFYKSYIYFLGVSKMIIINVFCATEN